MNFNATSGKPENLHFDVQYFSIAYKVSAAEKVENNYLLWHWRVIETLKKNCLSFEKWHDEVGEFNASSGNSQNLHFDGLFL